MRVLFTASAPMLAVSLALAGCSDEPSQREVHDQEVTDLNSSNTDGKVDAQAKALPAGDFSEITFGGRTGEATTAMTTSAGSFADMRGFVTCPRGIDPCDPKSVPEGTRFTYVFVVYPGGDNKGETGIGSNNAASEIERATAFRMAMPAHGFTGRAGYSKPEALAAIGKKADVVISCDEGKIVWTVSAGDGGDQWGQKEPLTFYWESALPPSGNAAAYVFDADGTSATGSGPYPAARKGVANACA